jgi:hypothetical protein
MLVTLRFCCKNTRLEDPLEGLFDLSQTVGSVKEAIRDQIPGASSTQLRFELYRKGILVNDQKLAEIFPQGGFHIVEVTVLPPQSIVVPTFESSTLRSVSTEPRTKSGCPPIPAPVTPEPVPSSSDDPLVIAITKTLSLPSNRIIDDLHRILSRDVDRDILNSLYSSAVEDCTTIKSQSQFLVNKILEMGLHDYLHVEESFACPVCLKEHSKAYVFEFMCGLDQEDQEGEAHALCYKCSEKYINSFVSDGNPNIECFHVGCHHKLSLDEIALILGNGSIPHGREHPHFNTIDVLKRDFVVGLDPSQYAICPGSDCNYFVARSENGAIEKASCPLCHLNFCTNCLRTYHYRTTCTEVRQLEDAWRTWTVSGRAHYWQHDKEMRRKAQELGDAERKRVEAVRKAEYEDEQWKAANCRHCPHCDRLVNKLEGCNAMRCGFDTDTKGNVQTGCRSAFDWNKAKPYIPVEAGANVTITAIPQNEKKSHPSWKCDECNKDIVGLRFSCVNCETYSICERCDADERIVHTPGHFFEIVER